MVRRSLIPVLAGLCAILASGCAEQSLADTAVPAGFAFNNSRPVAVTVSAGASALRPGEVGGLEIANPRGQVLFRGPLRAGAPVQVKLAVPLAQGTLKASLSTPSTTRTADLQVAADAATHQFE